MKLGFHISIAGGLNKVIERALKRGCETIQLFSRNPRGWKYKPLNEEGIKEFLKGIEFNFVSPVFVHMPYLPNLASEKEDLFRKSVDSLVEDLKRSEKLQAQYLIVHAGSNRKIKKGIKRMIEGIIEAFKRIKNGVILLIENTAGGGNELGYDFSQLKEIIDGVGDKERIGIVFDTAHAFEAGYDLRTERAVDGTIRNLDRTVGLKGVHLVHFNDSKTPYGSKIDRHWHIGKGEIGKGMGFIINHPALKDLPFIMETPRTDTKEDIMNMKLAQALLKVKK